MRALIGAIPIMLMTASSALPAHLPPHVKYLFAEADKIKSAGNEMKKEADRVRSEGDRLNQEASQLRRAATKLDDMWGAANRVAPDKFTDYSGRDRSQQRMRADAQREDLDADSLRAEGSRLDEEAKRLWKLSEAVNAQARMDMINLFRGCCKADLIEFYRAAIVRMAHNLNINYVPSR